MARYIDAEKMPNDEFWDDLSDREKAKVLQYLIGMPTADVVPTSEADKWYNALMGECIMSCCPLHDELRAEVAMEIFKKIKKLCDKFLNREILCHEFLAAFAELEGLYDIQEEDLQ
jgi:hypothetical protein